VNFRNNKAMDANVREVGHWIVSGIKQRLE
jgi:hypothetical protein